jgi:predicted DsbA family dithiol-disulfide isomerase
VERLFRAYFVEGRSIFDAQSLIALAREAYADAVAADIQEAGSLRVRGVPFFLFDGRYALSGAQPADVFREALEQAQGAAARL